MIDAEVVVDGFDKLHMSDKTIHEILKHYPKGWVAGEVDSVAYADTTAQMPSEYGIQHSSAGFADTKGSGTTKIQMLEMDAFQLNALHTLHHELGHANDWETDNNMPPETKKKLLQKVTERFLLGEGTRYYSSYVESIHNDDPQEELKHKVKEYWAEICEAYFASPDWLRDEHPEDFALVDEWVRNADPEYDLTNINGMIQELEKNEKRQRFLKEYGEEALATIDSLDAEYDVKLAELTKGPQNSKDLGIEQRRLEVEYHEKKFVSLLSPEAQKELGHLQNDFHDRAVQCVESGGNINDVYDACVDAVEQFAEKFDIPGRDEYVRDYLYNSVGNRIYNVEESYDS